MLTGAAIRDRKFVEGAESKGFRGPSYDIHIDKIVDPQGKTLDEYNIPPQEIVQVISKEKIIIPKGCAAHAMVKTGLCNEGLMALNTGILDPGWSGNISSFIVNFSKVPRHLHRQQAFLRLSFFDLIGNTEDYFQSVSMNSDDYVNAKKKLAVEGFDDTFLNIKKIQEEFAKDIFNKYRGQVLWYFPLAAFLLSLLVFLLNYGGVYLLQNSLQPSEIAKARSIYDNYNQQFEVVQLQNQELTRQNEILSRRVDQLQTQIMPKKPSVAH